MSEQKIPNLGHLCDDGSARDAVHIAVAPVIATTVLEPGQHVGVVDGVASKLAEHIGIVDPYLTYPVLPGQRFWLFLYPNTVTSLRHVWTHPAFKPKVPNAV